jgi:hypothetical protein
MHFPDESNNVRYCPSGMCLLISGTSTVRRVVIRAEFLPKESRR